MLGSIGVKVNINDKIINLETGKVAKQADGSVVVSCEDTTVLVTAVSSEEEKEGIDFFPLLVDYEEKFYAAGKIPGGFFKREGRPSNNAILISRLIDRPLRPLFSEKYRKEVQIIATVLSYDQKNLPDILAIIGASAALWLSDIPIQCPIGAVRIGLINKELVVNPTVQELENSELDLVVAGTKDSVIMMEGEAKEVSEEIILKAVDLAQESIKNIVEKQEKLLELVGKPELKEKLFSPLEEAGDKEALYEKIKNDFGEEIKKALCIIEKEERAQSLKNIFNDLKEKFFEEGEDKEIFLKEIFDKICKKIVRDLIIKEKVRVDGRKLDEIRPISCEIGILPRVHGSALFTRGQTQALVLTTLGTIKDRQFIDTLEEESSERFYLHYNFPPYSVGEISPRRGQSRREIGHGALAEKALRFSIPSEEEFPYTIRVVSEILESNGSSSMATVCGSSLSLMDAGVPIKRPIAGMAMGLIKENNEVEVLTDILGIEDHFGDMDFKAAGSSEGITAIQMDLKIAGIDRSIMDKILQKAKKARLIVLEKMNAAISAPKKSLSIYAPKISILKIDPSKIGLVIGPSGKNIKKIIETTGASIDIKEDGEIFISSPEQEAVTQSKNMIESLIKEARVGDIYKGRVTRTTGFGAFVEILPGKEGLVHISKLSKKHVARVEDIVKVNDDILVKVTGIDSQGRIDLRKVEADENNILIDEEEKQENYD